MTPAEQLFLQSQWQHKPATLRTLQELQNLQGHKANEETLKLMHHQHLITFIRDEFSSPFAFKERHKIINGMFCHATIQTL